MRKSDSLFKKWVKPLIKDDTQVICIYCKCQINAKRSDLARHMNTAKHQKTIKQFNNTELRQPELSFARNTTEEQNSQTIFALYIADHNPFLSTNQILIYIVQNILAL